MAHLGDDAIVTTAQLLVGAASTAATAEAICFELLQCRDERATRLQDPIWLEARLSPPC